VVEVHSVAPGVHVAHALFTHEPGHELDTQSPELLQVSTVPAAEPQRLLPGLQEPPHRLLTHAFGQALGLLHSPLSPQVCSSMFDEHCLLPGLQCPPQVLPLHTKSQLLCGPH
jgi:hypothetical protein